MSRCHRVPALALPALLLAGGAQGQTGACEQLSARLSARIESTGVRGYTLEVVPAAAAVPRDGKVIGTCEGGARKVVYRRWGGAAVASSAVAPASAPEPQPTAPPPPASQAAVAAPPPASAPEPEPAASVAPRAVAPAAAASAPVPVPETARLAGWWPWLVAGLLVVAGGWLWRSRFSAYDKHGLPRGPRL